DNLVRSLSSVLEWTDPPQLERRLKSLARGVSGTAVQHLRQVVLAGEKLPILSPHDLRHTYATIALIKGVPAEVVSKVLGHARVSTTLDIYRHVLDTERRRAAIDLFEDLVSAAPVIPKLRAPLNLN
ncbi:MAG: tyrosine-type recombinase/integrase, partial [Pseudopedobacter sp.]|nr:tyrosine-type recombinase/integrase [Deinococcales bacterium]